MTKHQYYYSLINSSTFANETLRNLACPWWYQMSDANAIDEQLSWLLMQLNEGQSGCPCIMMWNCESNNELLGQMLVIDFKCFMFRSCLGRELKEIDHCECIMPCHFVWIINFDITCNSCQSSWCCLSFSTTKQF